MWRIVVLLELLPRPLWPQINREKGKHRPVLSLFNNKKQLHYHCKLLTDCLVILVRVS